MTERLWASPNTIPPAERTSMARPRIVYTISFGKNGGWIIKIRGEKVARWNYEFKYNAVAFITAKARDDWRQDFIKGQVICKGKNGRIQWERGYPDTTRRRKG